jgi:MoxR-like ATPase
LRIPVDYPTPAEERFIVEHLEGGPPPVARLLDPEDVVALQRAARAVHIDEATRDYAVRLVLATRDPAAHGLPRLVGQLEYGASPRASIGLVRAAKALALLRGRDVATPQEVYDVAYDVLNLRLVLTYRALADGLTIDDVLVELLSSVRAPASPAAWGRSVPQAALIAQPIPYPIPQPTPQVDDAAQLVVPPTTPGTTGGDVPFAIGSATPTSGPMATPPVHIAVAGLAAPPAEAPSPAAEALPAAAPQPAAASLSPAPPSPAAAPQPPMYLPPAG